eukprot:GEMP01030441.1.p1 GENE.GEMP01030441.1~~GEMP01030441.1.p1  ORF type:complete len:332 (+),score=72.21 GEMP01030441.1:397-1392(+)
MSSSTAVPDSSAVVAPSRSIFSNMLQKVDDDLYFAPASVLFKPFGARGVFGGQVMAFALEAVLQSRAHDEGMQVHSTHSAFLSPGNSDAIIVFQVRDLRTGKSFAQVNITAKQGGKAIFTSLVSLTRIEPSQMDYHDAMPDVPPPDECKSRQQVAIEFMVDPTVSSAARRRFETLWTVMEERTKKRLNAYQGDTRYCPLPADSTSGKLGLLPARRTYWYRIGWPTLNDDRNTHAVLLSAISDDHIAAVVMDAWGLWGLHRIIPAMICTLNHTVWFHGDPFRMDEWLLFDMKCSKTAFNRALATAQIYTSSGRLAVTVTQEVLLRHYPDAKL